jgi:hypothetical protein
MSAHATYRWLSSFSLDACICEHLVAVVERLPENVRIDLMEDPAFTICDFEPGPGVIFHVPMRFTKRGKPGRSIVLKRTIKRRSVPFARWVIAHELAHAYLRHGGRFPDEDPELAADSLAAEWGFPKPEFR